MYKIVREAKRLYPSLDLSGVPLGWVYSLVKPYMHRIKDAAEVLAKHCLYNKGAIIAAVKMRQALKQKRRSKKSSWKNVGIGALKGSGQELQDFLDTFDLSHDFVGNIKRVAERNSHQLTSEQRSWISNASTDDVVDIVGSLDLKTLL